MKKDPIVRRKIQNINAARRYRYKKKEVESKIEEEERKLLKRNSELKACLKGIELNLKNIKNRMTKYGLVVKCFKHVI